MKIAAITLQGVYWMPDQVVTKVRNDYFDEMEGYRDFEDTLPICAHQRATEYLETEVLHVHVWVEEGEFAKSYPTQVFQRYYQTRG